MPDELDVQPPPSPESAGAPAAGGDPLFDARYRWVLLFALRSLRDEPDIDLDLDDPEQLGLAYELLSKTVQEHVRERRLSARLDPMRVSAIADSRVVTQTLREILRWERPRDAAAAGEGRPDWK